LAATPAGERTHQRATRRALSSAEYERLSDWDVDADVHVGSRRLTGFAAVPRDQRPLDQRWGEACADPHCIYRMLPLRVFGGVVEAFLAYVTDQAPTCGCKPVWLMDQVLVDLWSVQTTRPIRIGHLGGTWISKAVRLTPGALNGASLCSLQCEVVRIVKDRLAVDALQLPTPGRDRGVSYVVHPDAWAALRLVKLGPLQKAVLGR
jgi:hypothetical protein